MSTADLDLCYLSASDVLKLFRTCALSPVEYLAELIKRAEETEPAINSFAFTWFDQAMDQAKGAETKYARKDSNIRELEGLPIAVKDAADIKGQPLTKGSLYLKDNISRCSPLTIYLVLSP